MDLDKTFKLNLVLGEDILFGNESIKQITIEDIRVIGEEMLDVYLYPFCLIPDAISLPNELKEGYNIFEIYFIIDMLNKMQGNETKESSMIEKLKLSLAFFFNTDDIIIYDKTMQIIINHRTEINKDNFEYLTNIVLTMCRSQKIEIVKDNFEGKSEDFKKRYAKHLERRKQFKEKEKKDDGLYRIVNAVRKYEKISHKEIKSWTLWQVIDSYESNILKERYEHNLALTTICGAEDIKKLDLKHWTEKLIIKSN